MSFFDRYKVSLYNIGFLEMSPKDFLNKGISYNKDIHWLKHTYTDRMFADPYLLNVSEDVIEVLVEESEFLGPKAYISKLSICAKTYQLMFKEIVLKNKTHFSYPNIIRIDNHIYLLPENFESGALNLYEYDKSQSKFVFVKQLINEPLVDANILYAKGSYWLFASKRETDQSELYLWRADNIGGNYEPDGGMKIKEGLRGSRMGGNFFMVDNECYRVGQDCSVSYGYGLSIQKIENLDLVDYKENNVLNIYPLPHTPYPNGIHTLNFYHNLCVIDGRYNKPDFIRGGIRRFCEKTGIYIFD